MKKRELYIASFFIISLVIYISSFMGFVSFDFVGSWTGSPRAFMYGIAHAEDKNSEIAKLKEENKRLKEQLVEVERIKKDNEALRSQFQEAFIQSSKLVPAKVIGFAGKFTSPTRLLIDQGEKAGVKTGAAVIVGKDLIGKIGKTNSWSAEVLLINSSQFSTLAYTNKTNAQGILTGQEDLLLLDRVVITDELATGDLVLTKGEAHASGAIIPEGLFIGQIQDINKSESKPFQSAVIKKSIIPTKLLTVFVVLE